MRNKVILAGIGLVIFFLAFLTIVFSSTWSRLSFEATIEEVKTKENEEKHVIVRRTTEVYGNPLNELQISGKTKLIGSKGEDISFEKLEAGDSVKVTLANSFVEKEPLYYPSVFELIVLREGD